MDKQFISPASSGEPDDSQVPSTDSEPTEFDKLVQKASDKFYKIRMNLIGQAAINGAAESIRQHSRHMKPGERLSVSAFVPNGFDPVETVMSVMDIVSDLRSRVDVATKVTPKHVIFICQAKPGANQPR